MKRSDLQLLVLEALKHHGGTASVIQVAEYIWVRNKERLAESGDLYYTWQYDIRWAAQILRKAGKLRDAKLMPRGIWGLAE